ncbi:MAG TPA: hypothetical protein VGG27_10255 [Magnetospirillaceae bacterium]|jgi:hypothetical protein
MIALVKRAFDAWRGSGPSAVTVPPMDGALRPNQAIEEAPVLLEIAAPDNLVHDGTRLLFSSGSTVYAMKATGTESVAAFDRPVSALALHPGGAMAIGLEGRGLELRGGQHDGKVITELGGRPVLCPTALLFTDENTLLVALGSQQNAPERWKHDLMQRNASGSVWQVDLTNGKATCFADRLAYPYGLLAAGDGGVVVSESWRNQLIRIHPNRKPKVELSDISGYPARLAPTADGAGSWLAVFAPRSQLLEFVLHEPDYCDQMIQEIDPQFWIAPSLSATQSFLEPMQLGGLKQLGILKPWAPTRSYGLVVNLDGAFEPQVSFHSRADGRRHGITSCVEVSGRLLATSKGGNAIVSIPLAAGV